MYYSGPKSVNIFQLTLLCLALLGNDRFLLSFKVLVVALTLLSSVNLRNCYKYFKNFELKNLI